MSYDGAGNLSEKKLPDGTRLHFGYDALNRMVSLERHNPDGSTLRARYAYDVFNRRIRKSVSQSQDQNTRTRVTRYGWDGERMCAEVKDGLTRTTIYEPGSHVPLLRIDQEEQSPDPVPNLDLAPGVQRLFAPPRPNPPARIAHYHTDHLGTPLMLTGPDGKVLWRANPDDWAAVRDEKGETDQPIRFQGQLLDEESGLHYNFNRYYDPSLGRYVTQDPIGLAAGPNTYAYVNENPLSFTDPMGLASVEDYLDQWICSSGSWEEAFRKAREGKLVPGPDADQRTAAEHYIFGRGLRSEDNAASYLYAATGVVWSNIYYSAKYTGAWQFFGGGPTSPASLLQYEWGRRAWWDGIKDNFNKSYDKSPGRCGCSK